MIELQKGFNTTLIDVAVIAFHVWLYHRKGINPNSTVIELITSLLNFLMLRQFIIWSLTIMNFNKDITDNSYTLILELACYWLLQELYMYWVHRLMHKVKFLYNNIHRIHHITKAEDCFVAFFMHPLEVLFFIYPNLMVGPFIIQVYYGYTDKSAFIIWVCLATFYFVWSHSNDSNTIPDSYFPSTKHHWMHHLRQNCHYGSWLTDTIFGTIVKEER